MKLFKSALATVSILAITACFASAGDPVNKTCPVKGKDVDSSKTVDHTIKFCCDKCVTKFNKDPLAYVDKVAGAKEGKCAFSGKDVDDEATSTVTIGVCCGGCVKKVKADPDKYFAKLKKAS